MKKSDEKKQRLMFIHVFWFEKIRGLCFRRKYLLKMGKENKLIHMTGGSHFTHDTHFDWV